MTTVAHEIDGAVGIVTLAKPPHNLLDDALLEDLMTAYEAVVAEGARAILLRSSMRHFCVGAEVQSFGTTTIIHTDKKKFAQLMDVMENMPVPTVAALNGGVLGGGLEIALTCDMILAADAAFLG
jgi:enoyl-CoA hydratase/carnithine racemase